MINVLSTHIPREELQETIANIRICGTCRHGFWKGEECPNHSIGGLKIRVHESVKVLGVLERLSFVFSDGLKPKNKKKKVIKKKRLDKNCKVCATSSGYGQCCSELCKVRLQSAWYSKDGIQYISIEMAQERLEAIIERRRLRTFAKENIE